MFTFHPFVLEDALTRTFPLIQQLNPHMTESRFKDLLTRMFDCGNYRMVGVFDKAEDCVALSGYWLCCKFYAGPYLEVDNFVVDGKHRNAGLGKLLLDWLQEEARKLGCETILLNSYTTNQASHRFYYREGFVIRGYHFTKAL